MIQDLHSHTYYSFCGGDTPESIVEAAIAGGIELFGINDHNFGIGYQRLNLFDRPVPESGWSYERTLRRYFDHINLIREKYADKITVLRGIEICTHQDDGDYRHVLPPDADISYFDYCLVENLDWPNSVTEGDIIAYAKRCGCPAVGIAHTDLFAHIAKRGEDPLDYFKRMADQNVFWELNVTYDSIHQYREHAYVKAFLESEEQLDIVRRSGARLSIGFDGHRVGDYLPERIAGYCRRLEELGIPMIFA